MLKDKLIGLNDQPQVKKGCVVGNMMKTLDEETKQAFIQVMRSDIQATQIVRVLKSEGHPVSDTTLRRVRQNCFNSENGCECING
jgi:hypothetical protein